MILKINSWARGIIIAIIAGIIIQMILPEGKNKKYINVVIGVYILFCIISPIVGKNIDLEEYGLEKYLSVDARTKENNQDNIYDSNVEAIFKNNVIENIKTELKTKGYKSDNIELEIDKDCNIKKIKIIDIYEINKEEQNESKEDNIIEINTNINEVEIGIQDRPAKGILASDKDELIEYLSDNYKIDKKSVIIK